MGFLTTLKANQAYRLHASGKIDEAKEAYKAAYDGGLNAPKLLLAFALLLLREGEYEHAVEVLRKAEKAPGIKDEQKTQIISYYAIAIFKQGKLDRALELLRELFQKRKTGVLYGTLGLLLIEKAERIAAESGDTEEAQAAVDEALAFNLEAVDYDEDDPVCLDNLAQTYFRLLEDKTTARVYFDRALARKPGAIDTNFFLSLYDLEEGKNEEAAEKLETAAAGRFSPMNFATPEMVKTQLDKLRI